MLIRKEWNRCFSTAKWCALIPPSNLDRVKKWWKGCLTPSTFQPLLAYCEPVRACEKPCAHCLHPKQTLSGFIESLHVDGILNCVSSQQHLQCPAQMMSRGCQSLCNRHKTASSDRTNAPERTRLLLKMATKHCCRSTMAEAGAGVIPTIW